jgi:glycerophosphoryl diester phosphodiesterase
LLIVEKNWIIDEYIKEADKYNISVYVWTPNIEKEWKRLIKLGVKGLITDNPKKLLKYKQMDKK